MATLINANFWIYYNKDDDADRVTCKICRKSLKSKRNFNLKQHLKYAHKIEVRTDKKFSNIKNQHSITCSNETMKGVSFWTYFNNSDRDDRVTCKICYKTLKSNHGFNLRQHLKLSHKIEFRLQKRAYNKKTHQRSTNDTTSLTSQVKENSSLENIRSSRRNTQALHSNDSPSKMSTCSTIIDIKEETIQHPIDKNCVGTATPLQASNTESDNNEETSRQSPIISPQNHIQAAAISEVSNCKPNETSNVQTLAQNSLITPLFFSKPVTLVESPTDNRKDPLSNFDVTTNGEHSFNSKKKKTALLANDEATTASNKNGNFEIWAKKKKLLLEIEELEMRNYRIKLELWEKEQQLDLTCSKFTKDIKSK